MKTNNNWMVVKDDLYCKDCRKEMLQDIMKNDEELGLYEKPKQETLEEVA